MLFFPVHTASSSDFGLFLHAHLSMNFKHKPNDVCRATNSDDILTAAGTQLLFKSQNGSTPNFSVEYDTVLDFFVRLFIFIYSRIAKKRNRLKILLYMRTNKKK